MKILSTSFLAAILFFAHAPTAQSGVPDPGHSSCPPAVDVAADGSCCFDVIVRDVIGNPVSGSTVVVQFNCSVQFCAVQPPGIVVVGPNAVATQTDGTGRAHFCICGTLVPPCTADILADQVLICNDLPVTDRCTTPNVPSTWGLLKATYR